MRAVGDARVTSMKTSVNRDPYTRSRRPGCERWCHRDRVSKGAMLRSGSSEVDSKPADLWGEIRMYDQGMIRLGFVYPAGCTVGVER